MANTQNANGVADHAVPDDVGICGDQFSHIRSWYSTATVRKIRQAVASAGQAVRQVGSRPWVELLDISADEPNLGERGA
jgi:hypothetical protein